MIITDVRVRKVAKEGKMKAVVSITIDDEFYFPDSVYSCSTVISVNGICGDCVGIHADSYGYYRYEYHANLYLRYCTGFLEDWCISDYRNYHECCYLVSVL